MAPQILSKRNAHVLARFAAADVLVALDYDGTLAPIVSTPRKARMRPCTRQLLAAVAKRYPCVVISGRMRDDVTARVSSIPVWHVAGNHGLEPWGEQEAYAAKVRRWVRQLRLGLDGMVGVAIEDKTYSLTVHYRTAKRKEPARRAIAAAILWIAGSALFSWYLANFGDYNATYGSLGAVIGLMMWLWMSAIIILAGAELNSEIEHQAVVVQKDHAVAAAPKPTPSQ